MACGCKPTVTPGVCNRTINLCRYSPMTVLAVNPVCTSLPYNLTVVGAIGNIIYSIVNDGKSIAINSDETTDELAYITYTYNCNGVQQTCTLTINVQDRIEGTHAIELNACSSTCSLGDTTYLWTGFTDGCVELMPGYSATDCQIKVLVYEECEENLNNVISLEVCCGACLDGCCQTTTWTWNPPTFNDNCDADCTMYPCTVYDPVTGNCVSSCEHCETCCGGNTGDNINVTKTCTKIDDFNYLINLYSNNSGGNWILSSFVNIAEGDNCAVVTDYQIFNETVGSIDVDGQMTFNYISSSEISIEISTDGIPAPRGGFVIGYKVGDCIKYYAFQILALENQTPSNHCLGTFVFNDYLLEHNLLSDNPFYFCNTCTGTTTYCADCCDNLGCAKENCTNQPVCSSGECKCFIGQLEVPALPNGCCPAECTEDTIIPTCSTCVSGVIIPAPVCTETFVLNTNTCLCECPSGTVFDALTMTCIQVNCNVPGQTCPPCHNCVEGVCTPISCSGVPGMVNNPIGDGTVQNPCCIPDPCPNCIASLEVNKYCTDVLPRRANVSADATNYRIKFTQIQLNYLPFYSQVDCEYEALQAIIQTNNLTNTATYEINYTNYVLDWVPVTPSGTTLIIPQSAGNGFLIKCSWKGREVIYEFIFEEGFNGSADQLVLGEYPIQVRKVKDLTCGNVYGLSGDCQTTYSWEFTEAALNTSGQFITDNPIVVHATGPDAEICVNAVTQFNGVVCEETQVCMDIDGCQGACGCDPCNGGGTLFSTIEQVTTSDTLIFYASVFRDCGNGDELPIMFTCAPPTAAEYNEYINNDTLPDGCGTLPQMFDAKPVCANCGTFNCAIPGTADPATQLCGWWVDTTLLVPNSLVINGANIEFEILPAVEMIELCFGTNTECGYVCSCTIIENPEYVACELDLQLVPSYLPCSIGNAWGISSTVTQGTASYTYLWSTGATTANLTNLIPGTYTLTVTDANGCVVTQSITLSAIVELTASSTASAISCNGGTSTVTVTATGGTAPYTGTGTFTVSAGPYTYTVTDAAGCTAVTAGTITEPSLLNAACTKTDVTANGADDGTATVTVSGGTAPYTYGWNISASATTPTITGLAPGNYGVVVTDANGCVDNCGVVITEPACTLTAAFETSCTANSTTLSTITIEGISVSGANSGVFNITGTIGSRECTSDVPRWTFNGQQDFTPVAGVIQIPLNGNGNTDLFLIGTPLCLVEDQCVYYDLVITDANNMLCRHTISGCVPCLPSAITYNCENGQCVDPTDGTGTYTGANALNNCKIDCCTTMSVLPIIECIDSAGGNLPFQNIFTPTCPNGMIVEALNLPNVNGWGFSGMAPNNYSIQYPAKVAAGTYAIDLSWACGTCTGVTTLDMVLLPAPLIGVVDAVLINECPSTTVNLYSNVTALTTPYNLNTVFKTDAVCQTDGTLLGGNIILDPTTYGTNGDVQVEYTDAAGCSVCKEFLVTITSCCTDSAGDSTNQYYCL